MLLCVMCILGAMLCVPYWFGQAFAYSGAFGRSTPDGKAAESLFDCRATVVFRLASSLLLISYSLRSLQLRVSRGHGWRAGFTRALVEHVAIGLACWLVLARVVLPVTLTQVVANVAEPCCR